MEIKILGTGCKKCEALHKLVLDVCASEGIEADIIKVQDLGEIAALGVMRTPALVVNGKVKIAGQVPGRDKLLEALKL